MTNADVVRGLDQSRTLPRLDAQACRALGRLYASAPAIGFALRERPVQLSLRHRDVVLAGAGGTAYAFRAGMHRGLLHLDDAALALLLGEPHATALPHELRTILLADALQPLVERVTLALGTGFEWLADPGPPSAVTDALCFELQGSDGSRGAAFGRLVFDDGAAWTDAVARLPAPAASALPAALRDLPAPLRLEIGHVALRLGELRSITRGDIVAIEPWSLQGAVLGVRAYVGRHTRPAFRAEVRGTTLTVLPFQDAMTMKTADPATKPAPGDALDPSLESLEGLEVTVRFEAGQLQLPLRELGLVKPGHVFDLGQPLTQSVVRIVAHGSVVGKGQLVAIGERLGVRVTEFAAGDV
jgi:type III secretion protein Q